MKPSPLKCVASGLGLMLCGVSMARAQEQIHITPPSVGRVEQIAPIGGATVGAVLAKLRAHEMTPQEAWQSGALNVDDLIYLLENNVDEWGGFYWEKDVELRRDLEGLLIEHGGEKLKDTAGLSPKVRLWLADYYGSVKDARAVPLAESVLSEFKAPVSNGSALMFLALERLGWYYRDIDEPQNAAQVWLRMKEFQPADDWRIADSMIEAARMYAVAGDKSKAQELYARVPQVAKNWFTGMALYDRAYALIKADQHGEARQLLQTPLSGEGEEVKVGLLSLLSASYLKTGQVAAAQRSAQQAIEAYAAIAKPRTDMGLQDQVKRAKKVLAWCKQYQAQQNPTTASQDKATAPGAQ